MGVGKGGGGSWGEAHAGQGWEDTKTVYLSLCSPDKLRLLVHEEGAVTAPESIHLSDYSFAGRVS